MQIRTHVAQARSLTNGFGKKNCHSWVKAFSEELAWRLKGEQLGVYWGHAVSQLNSHLEKNSHISRTSA